MTVLKTWNAIEQFTGWDRRTLKKLVESENFPVRKAGGQYISTTDLINKWLNDKFIIFSSTGVRF